jgi:hypothetical protein
MAGCEVFIRLAIVFCEIRERVRIAASFSTNARRCRASSIKAGNSGFRFVDSSIISSRKPSLIAFSFSSLDLLALFSLVVASLLIFARPIY